MTEHYYGDNLCKNCHENPVENPWSTCDECIDKYAEMGSADQTPKENSEHEKILTNRMKDDVEE